jgi:tripartite motif-containing protein 71
MPEQPPSFITKWGSFGKGDGQFNLPHGVALDSSDNVYVADTFTHRIQKFDSEGTFITKWGSKGEADGQFNFPTGVALDSSGNVYVTDIENNRIQKFG